MRDDRKSRNYTTIINNWLRLRRETMTLLVIFTGMVTSCQGDVSPPVGDSDSNQPYEPLNLETISFSASSAGENQGVSAGVHTITMCDLAYGGTSMIVARLVEYEVDRTPCEERPYRPRHTVVTVTVEHVVAGDDVEVGSLTFFKPGASVSSDFDIRPGDLMLINLREVEGLLWGIYPWKLYVNDDTVEAAPAQLEHTEIVYEVPYQYEDFVASARDHWEDYETLCEREREHMTEEMLVEYYYGEPRCTSHGGVEANQNQGESGDGENGGEFDG